MLSFFPTYLTIFSGTVRQCLYMIEELSGNVMLSQLKDNPPPPRQICWLSVARLSNNRVKVTQVY